MKLADEDRKRLKLALKALRSSKSLRVGQAVLCSRSESRAGNWRLHDAQAELFGTQALPREGIRATSVP